MTVRDRIIKAESLGWSNRALENAEPNWTGCITRCPLHPVEDRAVIRQEKPAVKLSSVVIRHT